MITIKKFYEFSVNENNQNSVAIINNKLDQIEQKLRKIFTFDEGDTDVKRFPTEENPEVGEKIEEKEPEKLQGGSLERPQFSKTYKSLKLIYFDEPFRYDVLFKINLDAAISPEGQEFDPESLTECEVEFKRYYDGDNTKLEGNLPPKKIEIDDINKELFENLLMELEEQFPNGVESDSDDVDSEDEFKIELEDEEESPE